MPTRMDWIVSFRRLRRKPLYTLTIALALGIGVGAVTIVFSWFEGLFLRRFRRCAIPARCKCSNSAAWTTQQRRSPTPTTGTWQRRLLLPWTY